MSALHELAEQVGIARQYVSAWGDTRTVPDASLIDLLKALGLQAKTEAEAIHTQRALAEQQQQRRLPPLWVLEQGQPAALPPTFAPTETWTIRQESGASLKGTGGLPTADLPLGYHRLDVQDASCTLAIVPTRAFAPPDWSRGERMWALTAQLYSLRSPRNWGVGDFTDLAALMQSAAESGADAVGLNPLHALFPDDFSRISPYSPSSRLFLNPIYLDVEAVPDFAESEAAQALVKDADFCRQLERARAAEQVDYAQVWRCKQPVLEALWVSFQRKHLGADAATERGRAFRRFQDARGEALRELGLFEALRAHFTAQGMQRWQDWPVPYRDASAPETARFAEQHRERLELHAYLQWEADRQLSHAAHAGVKAGMRVGLYLDVAVGVSPEGVEAWAHPSRLTPGSSVGAPPDIYNPRGQDWGLVPLHPRALRDEGYAPFIEAVRASMRHAGAIRLDHIIGLQRLWWIPAPRGADGGAYVRYPLDDLIGIVALESHRHRCLVVGEDLGTVPAGFREEMARRGILSYRLLMFEREGDAGTFIPPERYPPLAAVAVSTHDLPTLRGFWKGTDLALRRQLELYPSPESAAAAQQERVEARTQLLVALREAKLLTAEAAHQLVAEPDSSPAQGALRQAAHLFLAQAPSPLLLVQLEDVLGQCEQMNLPGTVHEHPNWRRKLERPLENMGWESWVRQLREARRAT